MATEARQRAIAPILLAATLLTWPALWNGYPLVFSDTGTYLSQAVEHYVGWDRPVFYSLFLLPLHLTLTTWPVIVAQALLATHTLHLVRRVLYPDASSWWLLPLVGGLAIATSLPWFAAQLMPDVFTGLLVLVLALLVFAPDRLSRRERIWLMAFATFMIAAHQSHVLLALALLLVLLPLRRWHGGAGFAWAAALPLALAVIALVSVNLAAFGRASLSPFGNVFLLARVIYDGPGMDVLRRDCPASGWRLCAYIDQMPAISDQFLWQRDGPVVRAGGGKVVSSEANAIIGAALRAEPGTELRAVLAHAAQQLGQFDSGDELQAWPDTVTPWIEREFPKFEAASYQRSRQSRGELAVPAWLQALHCAMALAGVAGCIAYACHCERSEAISGQLCAHIAQGTASSASPPRNDKRGRLMAEFAAAVLLALLANALITGGLSTPHDRYQSRVMWLPPLMLMLAAASVRPAASR